MPFDSEGNFTRIHSWEDDRINDIDIVTDHHDEEDNNLAEGLSQTFLRDGRVAMRGNIDAGNFQIKNLANGALDYDAVNRKQVLDKLDELKTEINDGQAVSRTDYADLFELVGTNFGAGDGVTTFNIPDYRGKFLRGLGGNSAEDVYTTQEEGLPDHTHMIANTNNGGSIYTTLGDNYLAREGGGSATSAVSYRLNGTDTVANVGKTNAASVANEIYGKSVHVTPVNQAVNYFIKAKED